MQEEQTLWNPTTSERKRRLKRYTVSIEHQGDFESERLWQHVSAAIMHEDMNLATEEKTALEEAQRGMTVIGSEVIIISWILVLWYLKVNLTLY